MPLATGTTIGPYEITGWIGAGGMGEVYRARDPRLGRDVAVKLIAEGYAADASRVQRFEQEARAAGRLNHPNVLTVYDADISHGRPFIASELLEGASLRDRLRTGPLPSRKAIDVARQIAEGLAAAHDKGIIHRDLKPDNIFITNDGRIKILDFGLAKLTQTDPSSRPSGHDTETGVVLGTAGYMSPEQLRGDVVDARSDLFSFGTILYEMLNGKSPFARKAGVEMMAAILNEDPPEGAGAPAIERIVHRCLEKSREARFQSARDLAFALQCLGSGSSAPDASPAPARTAVSRGWLIGGAIAALVITAAIATQQRRTPAPAPASTRLMIDLGSGTPLPLVPSQFGDLIALSRDGSAIAFTAEQPGGGNGSVIFVRALAEMEARPLAGSEGGGLPFFSPDGKAVAFFADGELRRANLAGGPVQRLAQAPNNRGGSWGDDGFIYFAPDRLPGSTIWRVAAAGGEAAPFTTLADGASIHVFPQVLAGSKALVYTSSATPGNYNDSDIVVQPLPTGTPAIIQRGGYHGRVANSGHVLFMHDGTLMATPVDLRRLEATGAAAPMVTNVRGNTITGGAQFSISEKGLLAYLPGPSVGSTTAMQLMDRAGTLTPLKGDFRNWMDVRFSPNGDRVAMTIRDRGSDIWIYELPRETLTRLTTDAGAHGKPVWSADGNRIVYAANAGAQPMNLAWRSADGSGNVVRIATSTKTQLPSAFHPSGRFLVYEESVTEANVDLMALPVGGSDGAWKFGDPIVIANGPSREFDAAFSPDGKWIAFVSEDTGRPQVLVMSFPELKQRRQISNTMGRSPAWTRDGKQIIYVENLQLMAVSVTTKSGTLLPDTPQPWADGRVAFRGPSRMFDLHPDGQHVVLAPMPAARSAADARPDKAALIFNFFDDLRRVRHQEP